MNVYIDLNYVAWCYAISAVLVLVYLVYTLVSDWNNGFGIRGSNIILTAFLAFTPIVNTWVVFSIVLDYFKQFLTADFRKGK